MLDVDGDVITANGSVVSGAAAQLIRSMLAKALSSRAGEDDASEADASDMDEDIKPLQLDADDLRSLLRGAAAGEPEVCDEAPKKRERRATVLQLCCLITTAFCLPGDLEFRTGRTKKMLPRI